MFNKVYTSSFNSIIKNINKINKKKTLFAIDIDNTILKMKQYIGSDPWFQWQVNLLSNDPNNKYCISKNFDDLLDKLMLIYNKSSMKQCELNQHIIVNDLIKKGYNIMYVTSRSPELEKVTLRDMIKNDYLLTDVFNKKETKYSFPFSDSKIKSLFTTNEINKYKLNNYKNISMSNGIFYTAGQHKGALTKLVIDYCDLDIDHIIAIDDYDKHINSFIDVFNNNVYGIIYNKLKNEVNEFNNTDKEIIHNQYLLFKEISIE